MQLAACHLWIEFCWVEFLQHDFFLASSLLCSMNFFLTKVSEISKIQGMRMPEIFMVLQMEV